MNQPLSISELNISKQRADPTLSKKSIEYNNSKLKFLKSEKHMLFGQVKLMESNALGVSLTRPK